MTAPKPADWQRLAEHVANRRGELGLTQNDIQAAGGPSVATVRWIEGAARDSYSSRTFRKLERALRWPAGHVDVILTGATLPQGEVAAGPDPVTLVRRIVEIRDNPNLSPDIRASAAGILRQISEIYAAAEEESRQQRAS